VLTTEAITTDDLADKAFEALETSGLKIADVYRAGAGRSRGDRAAAWAKKLTAQQVAEIRASKESSRSLGQRYGVSHTTVLGIRHGSLWRWVGA
jgi:hypothetical protein